MAERNHSDARTNLDKRARLEADEAVEQSMRRSEPGFASMDPDKQREIASKGGRAAHRKGTAHQFTSEEARVAGRKGGQKVSENREHMSQIGSRGGRAAHEKSDNAEGQH